jgi:hypothetical protein
VETIDLLAVAALAMWAGARMGSAHGVSRPRWRAAFGGLVILGVKHVLLRGGTFLGAYVVDSHAIPHVTRQEYLDAFGGVLVSFVLVAPIAALLGLAGGMLARRALRATPSFTD